MKKIVIVVGIVLLLIFACFIGSVITSTPQAVEDAIIERTPILEAVATLEPLLAIPTPAPRPTSTPEMSEGIGNIADLMEFVLYLEMIGPMTEILGTEAFGLSDQFGEMVDDPYVMFTDIWITKTAGHFVRMEQAADVLVEFDAPVLPDWPIVKEIETAFKCAGRETIRGIEDMIYGIDNVLPDVLEEGVVHMDAATVCIDRASELMDEFTEMTS